MKKNTGVAPSPKLQPHMLLVLLVLLMLLLPASLGTLTGCGGKYDKPLETSFAPRLSIYIYTKGHSGFDGAGSFGMNDGWMFVAYPDSGRFNAYFATAKVIPFVSFAGFTSPVVVGVGGSEVAVADTAGGIAVKVYSTDGGDPVREITDKEWLETGGLTIDNGGNLYVSDTGRNFIRCYTPAGKVRFGEDLADSGFGIGHVLSPRGIFYCETDNLLYIAEAGPEKAQVQRIRTDQPQTGVPFSPVKPFLRNFIDTLDVEKQLVEPVAVAVNDSMRIFVLDAFYGWIIEFDEEGNTTAIVTAPSSGGPISLEDANSLGTYLNRVYALEPATDTIHRWDREKPVSR